MRLLRCLLPVAALLTATTLLGASAAAQTEISSANILPRYVPGFEHLAGKIQNGDDIAVAYLGGSITAGAGATFTDLTSWRSRTQHGLRVLYETRPEQFTAINAGIGGTGSHLAAYRFQRDVLGTIGAPDLLLIEFTVNDRGLAPYADRLDHEWSVLRTLESLVQQTQEANPNAAILLVLGTSVEMITPDNPQGRQLLAIREQYARFASARGIPYVDLHSAFYGSLSVEVEWLYNRGDDVHPADYGHWVYSKAVLAKITDLVDYPFFPFPEFEPIDGVQPFPARARFVTAAQLPHATSDWIVEQTGENTALQPTLSRKEVLRAVRAGAELEYHFQGTSVSLWFQSRFLQQQENTANGSVQVFIDGRLVRTLVAGRAPMQGVEQTLGSYEPIASGLDPDRVHALRIRLSDDQPEGVLNLALHAILFDGRPGLEAGNIGSSNEIR